MRIETKYKVGDKVWIETSSKHCTETTVLTIDCYVCIDSTVYINYQLTDKGNVWFRNESAVYPTKEELLKAL